MSSDHEAEIRASAAAHADLGPGYDDAPPPGTDLEGRLASFAARLNAIELRLRESDEA
jgi:hypothetical protein